MIIVNADDLGRSQAETDAVLSCYTAGRITSASAMVFMVDSERAADLTKSTDLKIGLHLNLDEKFTSPGMPPELMRDHQSVARFLRCSKYAPALYNPLLRQKFRSLYHAQENEFIRLYGRPPSHVDGHRHTHLCTNMLLDGIIPRGYKVRRNFSPCGKKKGWGNRLYRALVDKWLQRRYEVTDYFFSLAQCLQIEKLGRVAELSETAKVELMTHPFNAAESTYLKSDACADMLRRAQKGSWAPA